MALDLGCNKSENKKPKPFKYPSSILESHRKKANMEERSGATPLLARQHSTLLNGSAFSEGCPVQGSPLRGALSTSPPTGLSYKPLEF